MEKPKLIRGNMDYWIEKLKENNSRSLARLLKTDKRKDLQNLRKSGLPQYDLYGCSYEEFTLENKALQNFIQKYLRLRRGFVVRALPNREGEKKGFKRKPTLGYLNYNSMKEFLEGVIGEDKDCYGIELSDWEPSAKSGIIFSSHKSLLAEVSDDGLDKFSHGGEPSTSYFIDYSQVGHLENKSQWFGRKSPEDKKLIKNTLWYLRRTTSSFSPWFMFGYFEFILTGGGEIKFIDYKDNKSYLG